MYFYDLFTAKSVIINGCRWLIGGDKQEMKWYVEALDGGFEQHHSVHFLPILSPQCPDAQLPDPPGHPDWCNMTPFSIDAAPPRDSRLACVGKASIDAHCSLIHSTQFAALNMEHATQLLNIASLWHLAEMPMHSHVQYSILIGERV